MVEKGCREKPIAKSEKVKWNRDSKSNGPPILGNRNEFQFEIYKKHKVLSDAIPLLWRG